MEANSRASRRLLRRGTRRVCLFVSTLLTATVLAPWGTAAAAGDPPLTFSRATLDAAIRCPATFSHPAREPVLLVHGTGMDYEWNYELTARALGYLGFDVCGVDLPGYSLGDIQESTEYVVNAINWIYARTGRKLDVVGHSQGNLQMRWAAKWWAGTRTKVDDMVFLASPAHGGPEADLSCLVECIAPFWQARQRSNFLAALNSGDETPGLISYTSIYSQTDEFVTPWTTSITAGATNIAVQDVCPGRVVTHGAFVYDAVSFRLMVDALSHAGTADPGRLSFDKCLELFAPTVTAADVVEFNSRAPVVLERMDFGPKVGAEPPLKAYALS